MADPIQTEVQSRDIPEYLRDYRSALLNAAFQSVFSKPFLQQNFPGATWYTAGQQAPATAAPSGAPAGGDTRTDTQVPEDGTAKSASANKIANALAMVSGQMPKMLGMVWDPKTRTYIPEAYKNIATKGLSKGGPTRANNGTTEDIIRAYEELRKNMPVGLLPDIYGAESGKSLTGGVTLPGGRNPFGSRRGPSQTSLFTTGTDFGTTLTDYNRPPDIRTGPPVVIGTGVSGTGGGYGPLPGGGTGGTGGGGTGGGAVGGGGGTGVTGGRGGGGVGGGGATGGGSGAGGVSGAPPIGTPASAAVLPVYTSGAAGTTEANRGAGGYNPAQYATDQQAAGLASLLGGQVARTNVVGPVAPPPQNLIDFGDGAQLNAGLVQQALGNITVDGVSRARTPSEMTQSLAGLRAEIAAGGGDTSQIDRLIQQNNQAYASGAATSPVGQPAKPPAGNKPGLGAVESTGVPPRRGGIGDLGLDRTSKPAVAFGGADEEPIAGRGSDVSGTRGGSEPAIDTRTSGRGADTSGTRGSGDSSKSKVDKGGVEAYSEQPSVDGAFKSTTSAGYDPFSRPDVGGFYSALQGVSPKRRSSEEEDDFRYGMAGGGLARFEIGDDGKVRNYSRGGAIRKQFGGGFGSPAMGGFGGGFSGMGQQSFPSSIPAGGMQVPSSGGFSPFLASMLRSGSNAYSSSLGGVSGPVSLESMGFQPDKAQKQSDWDTHPFLKGIPKPDASTFNNPNAQRPGESWIDHEMRVTSSNKAATPGPIASSIDPASFGGMSRGDTPVAPTMAEMSEPYRQNIMSAIGGGPRPIEDQQTIKPTGRMPQALAQPGLPVGPGTDQLGQPQIVDGNSMGGYRMPQMGGYGFPMSGIMGGYAPSFMGGMGGYGSPFMGGFGGFSGGYGMPQMGGMGYGYPFAGGMGGYSSPFMGGMGGYSSPFMGRMGYGYPMSGGMGGYSMPPMGGISSLMSQFGGGMSMPTFSNQMGFSGGAGLGSSMMQQQGAQPPTRQQRIQQTAPGYMPTQPAKMSEGGAIRKQSGGFGGPNLLGFGATQAPSAGGFGGPGGLAGFWNAANPENQVGTSMFNAPPVYGGQRILGFGQDFGQYTPGVGFTASKMTTGALAGAGMLPSVFSQFRDQSGREYSAIEPESDFGKGVANINYATDLAKKAAAMGSGLAEQVGQQGQLPSYLMTMMPGIQEMGFEDAIKVAPITAPTLAAPTGVTAPKLESFQLEAPQAVVSERTGVSAFGRPQSEQYMSPYQEAVTEAQKREAIRQANMLKAGRSAAAVRAGAFGGSRQAIQEGMAEEALQRQLGDIEATGRQKAYESAQAQFERDRAASLASQQSNVQAALQAALANQQAGLASGRENLGARLGVQNLAAQQALQAQLANQQAGLTVDQANLQSALATQQLGIQSGLEAAKASQSGDLATWQMQLDAIKQASAEQEAARQRDFSNRLAALQQAQSGAAGLAGLGGTMMGIPGMAQQLELQRLAAMQQAGGAIDARTEAALNMAYQDFINQQNFPYQQMNFLQGILGGVPTGMQVEGVQFQRPDTAGGLASLAGSIPGLISAIRNK